jgi:nitroreductase
MPVRTKDAWEIYEQDFPGTAPIEVQLRFLLRYAILAPSTRNTQPWRFAVDASTVHLFADHGRSQPVSDPDGREFHISLGCALENLLVAAEHFGYRHEVTYFPESGDGALVASVTFAPGGTQCPARAGITLDAIVQRHNDNSVYRPAPVPAEVRQRLQDCHLESELRLDLTDDHFFRRWVDELTLEADHLEFADPAFRKELGYWIGQGVFGMPRVLSQLGRFAVARLDLGDAVAKQDRKIVESAALLGLISTTSDTHLSHVRTGQLFERLWLTATTMGVSIHPMSQTMRFPDLRSAMAELLPVRGWVPQHLFLVGYSAKIHEAHHRTPRRPLGDVVVDGAYLPSMVGGQGAGKVSVDPTARRDIMGLGPTEFSDHLIERPIRSPQGLGPDRQTGPRRRVRQALRPRRIRPHHGYGESDHGEPPGRTHAGPRSGQPEPRCVSLRSATPAVRTLESRVQHAGTRPALNGSIA